MINDNKPHNLTLKTKKAQLSAFALTGVFNTIIDFTALNIGLFVFNLPLITANIISTSLALSFSYAVNGTWAFAGQGKHSKGQLIRFLAVTLFGLYALQTFVIFMLNNDTSPLSQIIPSILRMFNLASNTFLQSNIAKLIATIVTLIWNFILYKKFVFIKR